MRTRGKLSGLSRSREGSPLAANMICMFGVLFWALLLLCPAVVAEDSATDGPVVMKPLRPRELAEILGRPVEDESIVPFSRLSPQDQAQLVFGTPGGKRHQASWATPCRSSTLVST